MIIDNYLLALQRGSGDGGGSYGGGGGGGSGDGGRNVNGDDCLKKDEEFILLPVVHSRKELRRPDC